MALRTLIGSQLKFNTSLCAVSSYKICVIHRFTNTLPQKKASRTKNIWNKLFGKYLFMTNVASSGLLMVVGDIISQEFEYRRNIVSERCNLERIAKMFIVGALQGPIHHYFYKWMDNIMPVVSMTSVAKKIALDQFVMSPICIVSFFYAACALENKNLEAANNEIRSKFLTVYMVDWLVWPPAQFINFYWLHPKYRVIYVNAVTMLYNIFLSYIKHIPETTTT